jgi:anti-anti-sigma factor
MTQNAFFEIERSYDVCILRISGRLASGSDAGYLWTKAQEINSLGCHKLVADIAKLDSIGSLGIGFFVALHTSTKKHADGRFVLAGATSRVREVLALTGLSTIIAMAEDLPAGLRFVRDENEKVRQAAGSTG